MVVFSFSLVSVYPRTDYITEKIVSQYPQEAKFRRECMRAVSFDIKADFSSISVAFFPALW